MSRSTLPRLPQNEHLLSIELANTGKARRLETSVAGPSEEPFSWDNLITMTIDDNIMSEENGVTVFVPELD